MTVWLEGKGKRAPVVHGVSKNLKWAVGICNCPGAASWSPASAGQTLLTDSWVVVGQCCYSAGGPALLQQWKSRGSCSTAAVEVQGVLLYCSSGSRAKQLQASCKGTSKKLARPGSPQNFPTNEVHILPERLAKLGSLAIP
ncbi:hypothetical protein NQZ68_026454 [Dissostichus eleginoides]|nr:hypothetical protein NQZ68_026454 [Dissostichus eleginoides]